MKKFAELVIEDLLNRSEYNLSDYVLITPGKRTGVILKYVLSQTIEKPVVAPTNYTINEFIEKYSGLDQLETIPAVLSLYELYKKRVSNAENIDQFWFFGEMLLADFDDIDKYMVDSSKLFKYIVDIKEIDAMFGGDDEDKLQLIRKFWLALYKGTMEQDKDKIRGRFLHFWKILYPLYKEYKEKLAAENKGYEGMLYRAVAEKATTNKLQMDGKIPVFIGFNALSESERQIFKQLKNQNALFYWDFDLWYTDDKTQEAGYFMRKNLKDFPNALASNKYFDNLPNLQKAKMIGVPGELEMAQELAQEVHTQFQTTENPLTNGIILGDETLLIPALQSIQATDALNVTMGLPFRSTALYGFINSLLEMPLKRKITANKVLFSAEWTVEIMQHPFWVDEGYGEFLNKVKDQNLFYISAEELSAFEDVKVCFPAEKTDVLIYLKQVLIYLIEKNDEVNRLSEINLEAAVRVYKALNQIEKQVQTYDSQLGSNMLISLVRKVISSLNLTLEGEPLKGNQLMGLIEARSLDFDNLIIVSANEGFLPSASVAPSFIPYNLRKAYGLLTYENQDAIFAYYFYRAVQRTNNLTFIYNSNENDNNYGERSRFLQQMAFELDLSIDEVTKSHLIKSQGQTEIVIEKTDDILKELNGYLDGKRLMYPLQLNTYISCKLKYYFTYIAGLKEPEKIEPGVDQRIFGLIFHETMEDLYQPFIKSGKVVSKNELKKLNDTQIIIERIRYNMQRYFSDIDLYRKDNGMVELIEQVVLRYVRRVLNNDIQSDLFSIPGLEGKYVSDYTFTKGKTIKLAGKIDRLQQVENQMWVIDYKTGRSSVKKKTLFEDLFKFNNAERSDGAFQAYLYANIVENQPFAGGLGVVPSLLYIQDDKPQKEVAFNDRKGAKYSDLKDEFEEGLNFVLDDLFDDSASFTQTEDVAKCRFCPFKIICQR